VEGEPQLKELAGYFQGKSAFFRPAFQLGEAVTDSRTISDEELDEVDRLEREAGGVLAVPKHMAQQRWKKAEH
jgi:hypothetical protein